MIKIFKKVVLTEPAHERALPISVLKKEFLRYGIKATAEKSLQHAYKSTIRKLGKNDQLYVMGSHFLIGEILNLSTKRT